MIERALTCLSALLNVALVVGILASQIRFCVKHHDIDAEESTFNDRITAISERLSR